MLCDAAESGRVNGCACRSHQDPVPRISRSEPDDIYIYAAYAMRFEEIRIDLNMPHTFPRIPPALAQKKPDLP